MSTFNITVLSMNEYFNKIIRKDENYFLDYCIIFLHICLDQTIDFNEISSQSIDSIDDLVCLNHLFHDNFGGRLFPLWIDEDKNID